QEATLEVGDTKVESFPIPYAEFTPPGGIEAPLVFADRKRLFQTGDFEGKVVVAEVGFPPLPLALLNKISMGRHDPDDSIKDVNHPATFVRLGWHLYKLAARRGAAGFIGIVKDQPGGSCRMYAPYGTMEKPIFHRPIPGFWVSKNDGDDLLRLARSGRGRAKMKLTGSRAPGITHNVVGEIPGKSDEVVVLSCHHDSPFESPVEDGSGVAVVLALARHFAKSKDLNRRLVVLLTAGHFYGSIGTRTFIKEHQADVVPQTAVEISIEHIALEAAEDRRGNLAPTGHPEATGVFVPFSKKATEAVLEGLRNNDVRRTFLLPAEGPLGNYPPTDGGDWYQAGVPVVNFISNPVYLLTADDALKWVDHDRLPRVAAAFSEIIRKLDRIPKKEIAAVDSLGYKLLMKMLKHFVYAKTTSFGLKPLF
ncbi:M28 family peptidase, partial [Myxococcota bacterium]